MKNQKRSYNRKAPMRKGVDDKVIIDCSACDNKLTKCRAHPLLNVPMCSGCWDSYHLGEFIIEDENEKYCRWCGEGGRLVLCESCPKSFCIECIQRNFGEAEKCRILQLEDRWSCFLCVPHVVEDLSIKNGWDEIFAINKEKMIQTIPKYCVCSDVTNGREKFAIPVYNEVDNAAAPLNFVYVSKHISGGPFMTNNPSFLSCCTCTDNCRDPTRCECIIRMNGAAYDEDKTLIKDKPEGIYECNELCSCHMSSCQNRVVGNGPALQLEVFRCHDTNKGWGVRCATDIHSGTYVADYIGEVIPEILVERRGLELGDEYLFNLDKFSRSQACQALCDLGMKSGLQHVPAHLDVDIAAMSKEGIRDLLGDETFELLQNHGSIDRYANEYKTHSTLHDNFFSYENQHEGYEENLININKQQMNSVYESTTTWVDSSKRRRIKIRSKACDIIRDRAILRAEETFGSFTIDARWFGSVGRFLNHSCSPNIDIVTVFADSHNAQIPRVAFFANQFIKAKTELCYDYGYYPGNVADKSKPCLCGAYNCRKVWY